MVDIVRNRKDVPDGEFVEFSVYENPTNKGKIFGYYSFDRQTGPKQVSFVQSEYGVDVLAAFEAAKEFAEANSIPTILINDPDSLFK